MNIRVKYKNDSRESSQEKSEAQEATTLKQNPAISSEEEGVRKETKPVQQVRVKGKQDRGGCD